MPVNKRKPLFSFDENGSCPSASPFVPNVFCLLEGQNRPKLSGGHLGNLTSPQESNNYEGEGQMIMVQGE